MIHVIDPGYPGWMWWIWGSIILVGLILFAIGVASEIETLAGVGGLLVVFPAILGPVISFMVYDTDYKTAVETAITLEGYSNVSYDGESTFTAASPTGEYFSGYLAPLGDDTFKIVEIPS